MHWSCGFTPPPRLTLPREDLIYVVFVIDMADCRSFALFLDAHAHVLAATLQRSGVTSVYGAEDASTHAFAFPDLVHSAKQQSVQLFFLQRVSASGRRAACSAHKG